ncbi:MAG: hypothetical protein KBF64_08550 [Anaerolineaceae bacterium]|nr:hypothetical protein [Anaerolineaceae bacterium]
MSLKFWMGLKAVVEVIFGVGFVVAPVLLGSMFGMNLDKQGALMSQLFGTAFIFGALILWLCKNFPWPEAQKIVIAVTLSNAIGFVVTLIATLNGVWNALGWLPVGLYLVFGLVFAYFWFIKKSV